MALKAEGIWECEVLGASSGADDRGVPTVQVNVRITSGPSAGVPCTYEDRVDGKSALYVSRSLRAVGWGGQTLRTLREDVNTWIAKTGGKTTVEIKHLEIRNGKRAGEIWDKVNSIGRGPRVLKPIEGETLADADEALRRAMADDGATSGGDDFAAPHPADSYGDDLPFATISNVGLGEIAKVLR